MWPGAESKKAVFFWTTHIFQFDINTMRLCESCMEYSYLDSLPNVFEYYWKLVGRAMKKIHSGKFLYETIEESIIAAWELIDRGVIQSLFESMPKRVQKVISNKEKPVRCYFV